MSSGNLFPLSATFIDSIRDSAGVICEKEKISIDTQAIEHIFRSELFRDSWEKYYNLPSFALPLKFASALDELNVLSVIALLHFGSSFDYPLRNQTKYGAANAIKALVFSMYISSNTTEGDLLSAQGMSSIEEAKVAELMGVNVMVEKPHPTLVGVTIGELGGPLKRYVELVTRSINATGEMLMAAGYPNLGSLVAESLKAADGSADVFMEKLTRAVPAFKDSYMVDDTPIYIYSKAIYLLVTIHARFASISPPPFPVPQIADLPAASTCLEPSLLVHLGVIDLSQSSKLPGLWPSPQSMVDILEGSSRARPSEQGQQEEGPEGTAEQAYILRAAGILAIDTMVKVIKEMDTGKQGVTPYKMLGWLQGTLKEYAGHTGMKALVYRDTNQF
ncbi:hypothetical protein BKA70DRAFT_1260467 [Coprinopsis sp. MPI-PUGE-AT-0042]|nr:hypothetical protein BKA70DRAFT_1260467 [Coprinopsis sp. MPI-PUGE-AT-0042]